MVLFNLITSLVFGFIFQTANSKYRHSRQITFESNQNEFVGRGLLQSFVQGIDRLFDQSCLSWQIKKRSSFFFSDSKSIASRAAVDISSITVNQLDEEGSRASERIDDIIRFEENLIQNDVRVQPNTPSFSHVRIFQPTTDAKQLAQEALLVIEATRQLRQR